MGVAYKTVCIALGAAGLITAHSLPSYVGIMALANPSLAIILLPVGITVVWVAYRAVRCLTATATRSFVAPTIIGLVGVALIVAGMSFSQNPPGY